MKVSTSHTQALGGREEKEPRYETIFPPARDSMDMMCFCLSHAGTKKQVLTFVPSIHVE